MLGGIGWERAEPRGRTAEAAALPPRLVGVSSPQSAAHKCCK